MWKKYYVILLPQILVIFFLDGQDFILKRSILINVPFFWGTKEHEMKLKFMTPRQAKKDQHTLKEKIEKERIEKEEI